ncbi:hypothetical protein GALL_369020 [mine drainage metagenome]|uniref:Uncharacterized protein n=1 Tax=mine drainage metagenome TaxID=410659 RepID=A0A1J5QDR9_9ZZZZ
MQRLIDLAGTLDYPANGWFLGGVAFVSFSQSVEAGHHGLGVPHFSADTVVLEAEGARALHVPGGNFLLTADFHRVSGDLLLVGHNGHSVLVHGYFDAPTPPDLISGGGGVIAPALASRLAGVVAPGLFAANGAAVALHAIGVVQNLHGTVTVHHVDGSTDTLHQGATVYQGDVLQTGADGAVGLVFADRSTFSLGHDGRMVMDSLVYDPQSHTGHSSMSVVQGAFTFVSGSIAKTGPDAMTVHTPVMTIGIRGTTVAGMAAAEGAQNTVVLLPDADGGVGQIVVFSQNGLPQVLTQPNEVVQLSSAFQAPPVPVVLPPQQLQQLIPSLSDVQQMRPSQPPADPHIDGNGSNGGGQAAPGATSTPSSSGTPAPTTDTGHAAASAGGASAEMVTAAPGENLTGGQLVTLPVNVVLSQTTGQTDTALASLTAAVVTIEADLGSSESRGAAPSTQTHGSISSDVPATTSASSTAPVVTVVQQTSTSGGQATSSSSSGSSSSGSSSSGSSSSGSSSSGSSSSGSSSSGSSSSGSSSSGSSSSGSSSSGSSSSGSSSSGSSSSGSSSSGSSSSGSSSSGSSSSGSSSAGSSTVDTTITGSGSHYTLIGGNDVSVYHESLPASADSDLTLANTSWTILANGYSATVSLPMVGRAASGLDVVYANTAASPDSTAPTVSLAAAASAELFVEGSSSAASPYGSGTVEVTGGDIKTTVLDGFHHLVGGGGANVFEVGNGGFLGIDGGSGADSTLKLYNADAGLLVDLSGGHSAGDNVISATDVSLVLAMTTQADTLIGGSQAVTLIGSSGGGLIEAGSGNDTLYANLTQSDDAYGLVGATHALGAGATAYWSGIHTVVGYAGDGSYEVLYGDGNTNLQLSSWSAASPDAAFASTSVLNTALQWAALSANGAAVAYDISSEGGPLLSPPSVYVYNIASGQRLSVSSGQGLPMGNATSISDLAISADGAQVAIGESAGELLVVDARTAAQLAALIFSGDPRNLAFAADGRVVLFQDGNGNVDSLTVATGATSALVSHVGDTQWQADASGQQIVYQSTSNYQVYYADLAAGTTVQLSSSSTDSAWDAAISANGRFVAFEESFADGSDKIVLRDLWSGTSDVVIESGNLSLSSMELSANGQYLFLGTAYASQIVELANPYFTAAGGQSTLIAGAGSDVLYGGLDIPSTTVLSVSGASASYDAGTTLEGGSGSSTLIGGGGSTRFIVAGGGVETLIGNGLADQQVLDLSGIASNLFVDLGSTYTDATAHQLIIGTITDTLSGIDNVVGGSGASSTLVGNTDANIIVAGSGQTTTIIGHGGADQIYLGANTNVLIVTPDYHAETIYLDNVSTALNEITHQDMSGGLLDVTRSGNDLLFHFTAAGGGGESTVKSFFTDTNTSLVLVDTGSGNTAEYVHQDTSGVLDSSVVFDGATLALNTLAGTHATELMIAGSDNMLVYTRDVTGAPGQMDVMVTGTHDLILSGDTSGLYFSTLSDSAANVTVDMANDLGTSADHVLNGTTYVMHEAVYEGATTWFTGLPDLYGTNNGDTLIGGQLTTNTVSASGDQRFVVGTGANVLMNAGADLSVTYGSPLNSLAGVEVDYSRSGSGITADLGGGDGSAYTLSLGDSGTEVLHETGTVVHDHVTDLLYNVTDLKGSAYNDVINITNGTAGSYHLMSSLGNDSYSITGTGGVVLDYSESSSAIIANLSGNPLGKGMSWTFDGYPLTETLAGGSVLHDYAGHAAYLDTLSGINDIMIGNNGGTIIGTGLPMGNDYPTTLDLSALSGVATVDLGASTVTESGYSASTVFADLSEIIGSPTGALFVGTVAEVSTGLSLIGSNSGDLGILSLTGTPSAGDTLWATLANFATLELGGTAQITLGDTAANEGLDSVVLSSGLMIGSEIQVDDFNGHSLGLSGNGSAGSMLSNTYVLAGSGVYTVSDSDMALVQMGTASLARGDWAASLTNGWATLVQASTTVIFEGGASHAWFNPSESAWLIPAGSNETALTIDVAVGGAAQMWLIGSSFSMTGAGSLNTATITSDQSGTFLASYEAGSVTGQDQLVFSDGSVSHTVTLSIGYDPGGDGSLGTTTLSGDLSLAYGSHLNLDVGAAGSDLLNGGGHAFTAGGDLNILPLAASSMSDGQTMTLAANLAADQGSFSHITGLDSYAASDIALLPVFANGSITLESHTAIESTSTLVDGTTGADYLMGGHGNQTLAGNGGADVILAVSGNDTVQVGDNSFVYLDGGSGTSQLQFDFSHAATIDLTGTGVLSATSTTDGVHRSDVVEHFGLVDLTHSAGSTLVLNEAAVSALTPSGSNGFITASNTALGGSVSTANAVVIGGTSGDVVNLTHTTTAWTHDAAVSLDINGATQSYQVYHTTLGGHAETVYVAPNVAVHSS